MKTLIIDEKNDNKKLNNVLLNEFKSLNINTLYKALRKKDIKVNSKRISENITVKLGDEIQVYITDEFLEDNSNNQLNIDSSITVYEDNNILVVNKPVGIEVTGDNSLTTSLNNHFNSEIYPCHRLDRNTCGLVLFAKNKEAEKVLLEKFKNQEIEKHYTCFVYGIPKKEHDILNGYLFKDTKKSLVIISDKKQTGYKEIITEYKVISKDQKNNTSKLEVILHTGRTHQIRAHLAYINLPIIGDGKYGRNEINKKFGYKVQRLCSTMLKFNFKNDSGILNYLNNKEIRIDYK